jgi:hypothetical protein
MKAAYCDVSRAKTEFDYPNTPLIVGLYNLWNSIKDKGYQKPVYWNDEDIEIRKNLPKVYQEKLI